MGITEAFEGQEVKKPPDLTDGPVIMKMKSRRNECLPHTLRVDIVSDKIHVSMLYIIYLNTERLFHLEINLKYGQICR